MAEWRENDAQWYEERMLHCATCGRMIAKRYLAASVGGEAKTFAARSAAISTTTTCSSSGGLTISHHQTSARRMRI